VGLRIWLGILGKLSRPARPANGGEDADEPYMIKLMDGGLRHHMIVILNQRESPGYGIKIVAQDAFLNI
jgi:hypothetical protein